MRSKIETYPIDGGWARVNPNDKQDWIGGCEWYRQNKNLKNKDGSTYTYEILVFEPRKQIVYGGYYGGDGWDHTLLSIKMAGANTYDVVERFYQDEEGGVKPGWKRNK